MSIFVENKFIRVLLRDRDRMEEYNMSVMYKEERNGCSYISYKFSTLFQRQPLEIRTNFSCQNQYRIFVHVEKRIARTRRISDK